MLSRYLISVLVVVTYAYVHGETPSSNQWEKRGFTDLGCMGVHDRAKFARLDRVCEECYQLFRESDVHTQCRSNCFKNTFFIQCIDVLLLKKDQQRLGNMVEQLYG